METLREITEVIVFFLPQQLLAVVVVVLGVTNKQEMLVEALVVTLEIMGAQTLLNKLIKV
jgi:hypothetical protein